MGQEDIIAKRYARGLAECAADSGDIDGVRRDLAFLAGLVEPRSASHVPEFLDFLTSPVGTPEDKLAATTAIMEKAGVGKTVADFVRVLIRKNRAALLPRIASAFADLAGAMIGECTAVVHTARALTEDQATRLAQVLASAFGGTVRLRQHIEPGLLAGARVTVGDKTFDGTVLGRLETLKHRLVTCGDRDISAMFSEEGAGEGA